MERLMEETAGGARVETPAEAALTAAEGERSALERERANC
jgi:hypothetical protein